MNDQCKPSIQHMPKDAPSAAQAMVLPRRIPGGPRAYETWPVELEVEPWRP